MYDVVNILLNKLKPHERVKKIHVKKLIQEILRDKNINVPILIDKNTFIILDGHHRYTAAKEIGLSKIPCISVDYNNDAIINVQPLRKTITITKKRVITAGLSGKLFPQKTTKHTLFITPSYIITPLYILKNKQL